MNEIEVQQFIEAEVLTRFPDWKPNSTELADFAYYLKPFDVPTARQAVRAHAAESNWKRPVLKKILEHASDCRPKVQQQAKPARPEPTVFVGLLKSDTTLLAGYFQPVELPTPTNDPDVLLRAAEGLLERLMNTYGGTWQIFQQTTFAKMVLWRNQMRLGRHSEVINCDELRI